MLGGAARAQTPSANYSAVINQYCVTCHNQRAKTAGLTLDTAANTLNLHVTGIGAISLDELNAVTLADVDTANGPITITA